MKPFLQFLLMPMCLLLTSLGLQAQTPVAQYSFTGNANDAYGNNAVVNGASLTQDRFGWANNAFSFNGVQSAVTAKNTAATNTANESISFWIKVNALPAQGEAYVLSHGGWQERWKISLPSHGKPVFSTKNAAGVNVDMDSDSVPLPLGVWKHVVMTHDGTNNSIYINGV